MSAKTESELGYEIDLTKTFTEEVAPGKIDSDKAKKCWITSLPGWKKRTTKSEGRSEEPCPVSHPLSGIERDHCHRAGSSLEVDVSSGSAPKMTVRITMDMGASLNPDQERQIRSVLAYIASVMPESNKLIHDLFKQGGKAGGADDLMAFKSLFGVNDKAGE